MSDDRKPFILRPEQVPEPPQSGQYRDWLRWCVAVMDDDDSQLDFAASMFSQAIPRGGLTTKQAKWADKIISLVLRTHEQGLLDCQQPRGDLPECRGSDKPDLRVVDPEGTA